MDGYARQKSGEPRLSICHSCLNKYWLCHMPRIQHARLHVKCKHLLSIELKSSFSHAVETRPFWNLYSLIPTLAWEDEMSPLMWYVCGTRLSMGFEGVIAIELNFWMSLFLVMVICDQFVVFIIKIVNLYCSRYYEVELEFTRDLW